MTTLICDEMLAGLARWLRGAGHDTALAQAGASDALLIETARAEKRLLLSRDRALVAAAGAAGAPALLLTGDGIDAQAAELSAVPIDWISAPFTRCVVDNALLHPADAAEVARIPPRSQVVPGPILACPCCRRVYWPGSHVRRMRARLERWAAAAIQAHAGGSERPPAMTASAGPDRGDGGTSA
jgi:uncharacterized protein with PIN domain